jgi:beclin
MSNLTCQQCKQPVQIDESLSDLTPSNYELIAGSIPKTSGPRYGTTQDLLSKTPAHPSVKAAWERSQASQDSARRRSVATSGNSSHRHRASVAGGESFVLLQDSIVRNIPASPPNGVYSPSKGKGKATAKEAASVSQQQAPTVSPTPLSHHLRSVGRLHALLSAKTEVDHPLCDECTYLLLGILNRQLEETTKERDGYIAFEKQIKKEKEREGDKPALVDAEKRMESLKREEEAALHALLDADRERAELEAEMAQLELEEKMLEEEEAESVAWNRLESARG